MPEIPVDSRVKCVRWAGRPREKFPPRHGLGTRGIAAGWLTLTPYLAKTFGVVHECITPVGRPRRGTRAAKALATGARGPHNEAVLSPRPRPPGGGMKGAPQRGGTMPYRPASLHVLVSGALRSEDL